jgi:SET domain-containing protein
MILVPTYVGPSEIEGVGVFAAAAIPKGTKIWHLDESFDRVLDEDDVARLGAPQREFVERYGYPHSRDPRLTIVEIDNGRFMNHSNSPNTDFTNPAAGYTRRDIAEGEEITCDYEEFAPGSEMLPGRQFVSNGGSAAGLGA